jgi:hypothetical protein
MLARRTLSLILLLAAAFSAESCADTPRPSTGGMAAGFAVVNGDFTSTSVSLLSPTGDLVSGDCVHTTTVNGTATISGDVVLPSQPQLGGKLVLVDRGNTALTFVDPATCTVDHQFSVKAGFNFANPHDVVILSDTKGYVTRYGVNPAPTDATSKGDDILIVDPRDGTVAGTIDLSSYAVAVAGVTMHARPDRAMLVDGKVVVSLNEASDFPTDLNGSITYAGGHLVVIDPATDTVTQDLALGELKGCEAMTYLADDKLLLVVCGGSFGADPAADSGIVPVDLSGSTAVLAGPISAVAFEDRAVSFQGIAALAAGGKRQAFVNTLGAFATASSDAIPDAALVVDLNGATAAAIASSTAYDLGAPALAGTRLLLPDATASMPRLRVVDVGVATPTEAAAFVTDATNGLPPRLVAAY